MKKLINAIKKEKKYQIKDLYVGEIVTYLLQSYNKDTKQTTKTIQPVKKKAILIKEEDVKFGYRYLKTNQVLSPVDFTVVGNFALKSETLTSFKDCFPDIMQQFNLTENSKLKLSQILKLEEHVNTHINLRDKEFTL